MRAQQSGLQVAGNNIANVNTPGYCRQKVSLRTGLPQNYNPVGSISIGVTVEDIKRVRDVFMDGIFRRETQNLGRYETLKNYLAQIESAFNEPSETGLSSLMSRFFNAFQDLANNPEDLSVRMVLRERGASLTNAINETYLRLSQLQQDIGETLKGKINEVNNIAQQIAKLNQQIKNSEAAKKITNELRDRRDLLVDQLSKLIDVDVLNKEDGTLIINAGQKNLVNDTSAYKLEMDIQQIDSSAQASVNLTINNSSLPSESRPAALSIRNGELKGLLDVHNDIIPRLKKQLDDLAAGLAEEVNELHKKGFGLDNSTGNSFFTFTSVSLTDNIGAASTIKINDAILADVRKIAASAESDAPSDNSIAIMISQLSTNRVMNGDTATFSDFYQSMIAELGAQSQNANQFSDAQKLVVSQINQRRESVSGVSLDEESIDLVNYQNAYQAAAQYINTVNELLDVVINRL